ncbi:glycoside hydrolase family 26 protein [Dinghuibacter silviterrae]|uniref:Mannan endo-1,4-beta-mannosidase n=1 Tax=Dinghuibacter silviterrae TaxID=1539049 RepID=A0A4R8DWV0_9BACT|nr:glycosyl hydrolase [Dinghuibacter silviterrae]TDX02408.1 mannan endo-1,4-beta-mannosidase [Dinghuibacter silviterrae]
MRILITIALLAVLLPSDRHASIQTVNLYRNLRRLSARGFLFGHQDDLAYGVGWRYEPGRSDVKDVCGDYPGLFGWDLSGRESGHDKDIDGVPFDSIRRYVREVYARGGVNTFSWHCPSPRGGTAWDTLPGSVGSILPGGVHHALYVQWLDSIAGFLGSLGGIPILFRPFHEHTGSWFWWGAHECTPAEYKALWQFTHHYLNDVKGLHNILWVFNAGDNFKSVSSFLERYPGDDYVDVVSFDAYQYGASFQHSLRASLCILDSAAFLTGKLEALAETGYEQVPDPHWWTGVLAPALAGHPLAYVLVWRNHGWNPYMNPPHNHYYAPYKGQVSAADFVQFYSLENTLFERDAAKAKLYDH